MESVISGPAGRSPGGVPADRRFADALARVRARADAPLFVGVDTIALRRNAERIAARLGRREPCAVLKGDAYGHGIDIVARHLAPMVSRFAVVDNREARAVLEQVPSARLSRLRIGSEREVRAAAETGLRIREMVSSPARAEMLVSVAGRARQPIAVDVPLDVSGLGREGMSVHDIDDVLAFLLALADTPGLAVECLSCSVVPRPELDGASQARALEAEVGLFLEIVRAHCRRCEVRGLARPETSILSTASSQLPVLGRLLDGTGLVCVDRIGNDFYGSHSSARFRADGAEQVMHAALEISDVIHRPRGATVGYERLYRVDASEGEPIAVAGVGWSSYGRAWQGRGKAARPGFVVDASGEVFCFVGRQSMNITTLAARSETGSTLHPGDLVFLLADERVVAGSGDRPTVAEVAARMGGVQHEHVTALIGLSHSAVRFGF